MCKKFRLRNLKKSDAKFMLEWMHDEDITRHLQADFKNKNINDCTDFIKMSTKDNMHLAIVNNNDEYLGTVSLKNIRNDNAEFAITIRKCSMGNGTSAFAIKEIIKYAFTINKLNYVY